MHKIFITISLLHASTCFEHMCSSSGGQNCIIQPLVYRWPSRAQVERGIRVAGWSTEAVLQPATRIPPQPSNTETPTHMETRTHGQCGDTIKNSQAPDVGCINIRNMLSIEEVK